MAGVFKKISDAVNRVSSWLAIIFFLIVICTCATQVFSRYVLNDSYGWTEEAARFAFIWLNMLGASICVKNKGHAMVTVVIDLLPAKARKFVDSIIYLLILYASVLMVTQGMVVVGVTTVQLSPALSIPMAYVYGCVPLCGVIIAVHVLADLAAIIFPERGESA